jgi:hypothetical protein
LAVIFLAGVAAETFAAVQTRSSARASTLYRSGSSLNVHETEDTGWQSEPTEVHVRADLSVALDVDIDSVATFSADYGTLRGRLDTEIFKGQEDPVESPGAHRAVGTGDHGSLIASNSGIGATFRDEITIVTSGTFDFTYRLHSDIHETGGINFAALHFDGFVDDRLTDPLPFDTIHHSRSFDLPREQTTVVTKSVYLAAGEEVDIIMELELNADIRHNRDAGPTLKFAIIDAMSTGNLGITSTDGGTFTSGSGASYVPIPEPTAAALLAVAAPILFARRRERTMPR